MLKTLSLLFISVLINNTFGMEEALNINKDVLITSIKKAYDPSQFLTLSFGSLGLVSSIAVLTSDLESPKLQNIIIYPPLTLFFSLFGSFSGILEKKSELINKIQNEKQNTKINLVDINNNINKNNNISKDKKYLSIALLLLSTVLYVYTEEKKFSLSCLFLYTINFIAACLGFNYLPAELKKHVYIINP